MKTLYDTPNIYDIGYNQDNEGPLIKHYEEVLKDKEISTIMDVSIGSGNLTLALLDMGYKVTGSDISPSMLQAAKDKAAQRHLQLDLIESDFRTIDQKLDQTFDCVMSTGNSLPHVDLEGLEAAFKAMANLTRPGGYLYWDTRNWDKIMKAHERFQYYQPMFLDGERVNVVLMKDYLEDQLVFNFLYAFEKAGRIHRTEERSVTYYPVTYGALEGILKSLGFDNFQVFNFVNRQTAVFEEMNWYAVICQKQG